MEIPTAAIVGLIGGALTAYTGNFVGEDFKRFRTGQALAGALAGELESHGKAVPTLRKILKGMLSKIKEVQQGLPINYDPPTPSSPIFDANTKDIGLLPPKLAKDVAFVYEQIRAFRGGMYFLFKNAKDLPVEGQCNLLRSLLKTIGRAVRAGIPLVSALKKHAQAIFFFRKDAIFTVYLPYLLLATFLVIAVVMSQTDKTEKTAANGDEKGQLHKILFAPSS
jgi:hypothetical protein